MSFCPILRKPHQLHSLFQTEALFFCLGKPNILRLDYTIFSSYRVHFGESQVNKVRREVKRKERERERARLLDHRRKSIFRDSDSKNSLPFSLFLTQSVVEAVTTNNSAPLFHISTHTRLTLSLILSLSLENVQCKQSEKDTCILIPYNI